MDDTISHWKWRYTHYRFLCQAKEYESSNAVPLGRSSNNFCQVQQKAAAELKVRMDAYTTLIKKDLGRNDFRVVYDIEYLKSDQVERIISIIQEYKPTKTILHLDTGSQPLLQRYIDAKETMDGRHC
jgi:hypothetical protein